ncbi:hypothetical protein HPB49_010161 [Dermacentor silvarum]|uniref:Uncharacterized protein n=1 Tax=Dermacentor silvarum TaxID=543639 RepID=A0ACB8CEF0_DERSI|nr:hypothetical protein HPB49_010161 [Dermacentor silvarum]
MLSEADEMLTTTDKPATIGALSDKDAASVSIAEHANDSQPGKDMDEDSTPFAIDTDTTEDEAYNGRAGRIGCLLFTSKMKMLSSGFSEAFDWMNGPDQHWPPRFGPHPNDPARTYLALISSPSSHVTDALLKFQKLSTSQHTYLVSAYLAVRDDSCKRVVPGLEPGTPSHMLADEVQASGIQTLQARMMGQSTIALVTFEGLLVPRLVRFLGAEFRGYPHRPRQAVCKTCLQLGHRTNHCPTPDVTICEQCGIDNIVPSHPRSRRCK